jgi:hypothetical protein
MEFFVPIHFYEVRMSNFFTKNSTLITFNDAVGVLLQQPNRQKSTTVYF